MHGQTKIKLTSNILVGMYVLSTEAANTLQAVWRLLYFYFVTPK